MLRPVQKLCTFFCELQGYVTKRFTHGHKIPCTGALHRQNVGSLVGGGAVQGGGRCREGPLELKWVDMCNFEPR